MLLRRAAGAGSGAWTGLDIGPGALAGLAAAPAASRASAGCAASPCAAMARRSCATSALSLRTSARSSSTASSWSDTPANSSGASGVPQWMQNLLSSVLSPPHTAQRICAPPLDNGGAKITRCALPCYAGPERVRCQGLTAAVRADFKPARRAWAGAGVRNNIVWAELRL